MCYIGGHKGKMNSHFSHHEHLGKFPHISFCHQPHNHHMLIPPSCSFPQVPLHQTSGSASLCSSLVAPGKTLLALSSFYSHPHSLTWLLPPPLKPAPSISIALLPKACDSGPHRKRIFTFLSSYDQSGLLDNLAYTPDLRPLLDHTCRVTVRVKSLGFWGFR